MTKKTFKFLFNSF